MGTDGAATVDQAVIELTQSGVNAVFGGPAGSVGDYIDGLDGHDICAVQIDGAVWVHRERKWTYRRVGLRGLGSETGLVQFLTGPHGSGSGPPVQLRAHLGSPRNGFRSRFVVAGARYDLRNGMDIWT